MKKFISLVLAVLMLVSVVPLSCASAVSQIPSDAIEFNGNYYKAFDISKSWTDAKSYCENLGGHLVTITSQEEQAFIESEILSNSPDKHFYLAGGYRIDNYSEWIWCTGEQFTYKKWHGTNGLEESQANQHYIWIISATAPEKAYDGVSGYYSLERYKWMSHLDEDNKDSIFNTKYTGFICEWEDIYNLGEETYGFKNYSDSDSGGHCFGMSVTSSGYYIGLLTKNFGVNNDKELCELVGTATVKEPICYYQGIQGSIRNSAMVAGGTNYRNENEFDIEADWNEVVNYVENHEYDDRGTLQIGYRKSGEGGHAINFLRYEEVEGQERIYAYDNNCPTKETYFYQDENGDVRQAVYSTFSGAIDCITLRDVSRYLLSVSAKENAEKYRRTAVYSDALITVDGATRYIMDGVIESGEYYVYEIPEAQTTVKITPLVDNASFMYMGKEYSFGEIDEDTYAELTLSTSEEEIPEFTIVNAPEDEPVEPEAPAEPEAPTKDCHCDCHKGGIAGFFWKILNFFYKLFKINKECSCGVSHY